MSIYRKSALAALAGAGLLGATGFAAPGPNDPVEPTSASRAACFRVNQVDGFAARGVDGVNLRATTGVFQADFTVPCPEIQESTRIAVQSVSGSNYICNGPDAVLIAYSRLANPQRCTIHTLRKLSKEEVAALPRNERP